MCAMLFHVIPDYVMECHVIYIFTWQFIECRLTKGIVREGYFAWCRNENYSEIHFPFPECPAVTSILFAYLTIFPAVDSSGC